MSYKLLTKMIVNRLKPLMPRLISPYQTGFVPGRCIHDNVVVAHEMLYNMSRMKGKTGFFVIKVDLTKAYDMLRWSCIHDVLREIGLPVDLIRFIMTCISFVQTNVLWNGARSPYFSPQRGGPARGSYVTLHFCSMSGETNPSYCRGCGGWVLESNVYW